MLHITFRCRETSPQTSAMPKILHRQPEWLATATPAHGLLSVGSPQGNEAYKTSEGKLEAPGLRTLASRGSEVFVADGKTIRWADLASMKSDWESKEEQSLPADHDSIIGHQYRVSCKALFGNVANSHRLSSSNMSLNRFYS